MTNPNKLREEIIEELSKLFAFYQTDCSVVAKRVEPIADEILYKIHQQIESSIPEIKKLKDNWKVCKDKDCDNKEMCEIANHYIETIWNPTFEEIITKLKNII